ncbi:hypothetical protein [Spiroplasma endosymbiont of Seladonia tumulorum]|uniref:hypothetical protein n=1 Tax=Spiroplasma endosymbiont of Seladonia tumulorum TaxID=3066321 RepID=UPI0030D5B24A
MDSQCYPFLFEIKIPSDASKMYIVDLNKYKATLAILINQGYSFKFISFSIIPEKSWEIIKIKLKLEKN